jgi:hypothetical protein
MQTLCVMHKNTKWLTKSSASGDSNMLNEVSEKCWHGTEQTVLIRLEYLRVKNDVANWLPEICLSDGNRIEPFGPELLMAVTTGLWRRVDPRDPGVSEENIVSIVRVESNQGTRRSRRQAQRGLLLTVKMEAICFCGHSRSLRSTRRYNQKAVLFIFTAARSSNPVK